MRATWGTVSLDVPDGWDDDTLILLKGPVPKPSVRMRAPTGEPRRPSLVVKRVPLASDVALHELAGAEAAMLKATIDGLVLEPESALDVDGAAATMRELTFPAPDGKMRQLHVSMIVARTFLVLVATALDDTDFPAVRDRALAIARSVRIVTPS